MGQGKTGKAAPCWGYVGFFRQGITLKKGKGQRASLVEGDALLAGRRLLPAQRLVESTTARQVGNAEGDEADCLFHNEPEVA